MPISELIIPLILFLAGLCIGSFLNVVIHRGPAIWGLVDKPVSEGTYNLAFPRSHCPHCQAQIRITHLIPILGFIMLKGRCSTCGHKISLRYPLVELLTGTLALLAYFFFNLTATTVFFFAFFCFLIPLALIDLRTSFLPDALTLPFGILGLFVNTLGFFTPLASSAAGALIGFLVFWLIGEFYYRVRSMDGLGLGDAKFLAGIGAWLGWAALPFVVLIASLLGLAGLLIQSLLGKEIKSDSAIPFGPFLAAGASGVMLLYVNGLAFWQL